MNHLSFELDIDDAFRLETKSFNEVHYLLDDMKLHLRVGSVNIQIGMLSCQNEIYDVSSL